MAGDSMKFSIERIMSESCKEDRASTSGHRINNIRSVEHSIQSILTKPDPTGATGFERGSGDLAERHQRSGATRFQPYPVPTYVDRTTGSQQSILIQRQGSSRVQPHPVPVYDSADPAIGYQQSNVVQRHEFIRVQSYPVGVCANPVNHLHPILHRPYESNLVQQHLHEVPSVVDPAAHSHRTVLHRPYESSFSHQLPVSTCVDPTAHLKRPDMDQQYESSFYHRLPVSTGFDSAFNSERPDLDRQYESSFVRPLPASKFLNPVDNSQGLIRSNFVVTARMQNNESESVTSTVNSGSRQDSTASRYLCSVCGTSFRHPSSFSRHKLGHRESRYPCERCGKRFKRSDTLGKHLQNGSCLERSNQLGRPTLQWSIPSNLWVPDNFKIYIKMTSKQNILI